MADKPTYRMSEAGKCPRALSAIRLGYTPEERPGWLTTAAEEGKWHETRIIEQLLFVSDEQKEVTLSYPTFKLIGHIDGILENPMPEPGLGTTEIKRLLEIKSMSQFEFDRWMRDGFKGFPEYAAQLTCYMEATGLKEALYIVKNRNSGYIDRQYITEQPADIDLIVTKLGIIESSIQEGKLVSGIEFEPHRIECRRCEFKNLCVPEPKQITKLDAGILNNAVRQWREGKILEAEALALIEEARKVLGAYANEQPEGKFKFSGLSVQQVLILRKTYDKAELLRLFTPEQLETALRIQEFEQLRIEDLEKESE